MKKYIRYVNELKTFFRKREDTIQNIMKDEAINKNPFIIQARQAAKDILLNLENEHEQNIIKSINFDGKNEVSYKSWIKGTIKLDSYNEIYPKNECQYFDRNGFLYLPSFASISDEVIPMKDYMKFLVNERWHPLMNNEKDDNNKVMKDGSLTVFRTDKEQEKKQGSSDYFLDSSNRIHFFAEKDAVDSENGSVILKEKYWKDKMAALNKSGHALHLPSENEKNPFHDYTTSTKIINLVDCLGWKDPVVPQSMYIFKQPHIGGAVTSHQDSTFLYTTPKQSCLGLWLALDDATLSNGCLWVRPKSHWESIRRKFKRNVNYFEKRDLTQPQMIFESLTTQDVAWEGALPGEEGKHGNIDGSKEDENEDPYKYIPFLLSAGFIPIECKAGDLLVFNGALDHLSLANVSDKQRHTFQLHLVEGSKAGVEWADTNWLQYPEGEQFLPLIK